jgi:hypothetical protein
MKDIEEMKAKKRREKQYHVLTVYSRVLDYIQGDILKFVLVFASFGG